MLMRASECTIQKNEEDEENRWKAHVFVNAKISTCVHLSNTPEK